VSSRGGELKQIQFLLGHVSVQTTEPCLGYKQKLRHAGVFGLNQGILDRLLSAANQFDFAILIWAGDDVTESKGLFKVSPRDNVIFECGLFMGAIGKTACSLFAIKALT
jgi:predicted nucleotide-binding protein